MATKNRTKWFQVRRRENMPTFHRLSHQQSLTLLPRLYSAQLNECLGFYNAFGLTLVLMALDESSTSRTCDGVATNASLPRVWMPTVDGKTERRRCVRRVRTSYCLWSAATTASSSTTTKESIAGFLDLCTATFVQLWIWT